MSKFISLVTLNDKQPVTINTDHIIRIEPLYQHQHQRYNMNAATIDLGGFVVDVNHSYDKVVDIIKLETRRK